MTDKFKRIMQLLKANDVDSYRVRKKMKAADAVARKQARDADGDEDTGWRTTSTGKHYHINSEGEVDKGPNAMKGSNVNKPSTWSKGSSGWESAAASAHKEATKGGTAVKAPPNFKPTTHVQKVDKNDRRAKGVITGARAGALAKVGENYYEKEMHGKWKPLDGSKALTNEELVKQLEGKSLEVQNSEKPRSGSAPIKAERVPNRIEVEEAELGTTVTFENGDVWHKQKTNWYNPETGEEKSDAGIHQRMKRENVGMNEENAIVQHKKYDKIPGKVEHLATLKNAEEGSIIEIPDSRGTVTYTKLGNMWSSNRGHHLTNEQMQEQGWGSEAEVVSPLKNSIETEKAVLKSHEPPAITATNKLKAGETKPGDVVDLSRSYQGEFGIETSNETWEKQENGKWIRKEIDGNSYYDGPGVTDEQMAIWASDPERNARLNNPTTLLRESNRNEMNKSKKASSKKTDYAQLHSGPSTSERPYMMQAIEKAKAGTKINLPDDPNGDKTKTSAFVKNGDHWEREDGGIKLTNAQMEYAMKINKMSNNSQTIIPPKETTEENSPFWQHEIAGLPTGAEPNGDIKVHETKRVMYSPKMDDDEADAVMHSIFGDSLIKGASGTYHTKNAYLGRYRDGELVIERLPEGVTEEDARKAMSGHKQEFAKKHFEDEGARQSLINAKNPTQVRKAVEKRLDSIRNGTHFATKNPRTGNVEYWKKDDQGSFYRLGKGTSGRNYGASELSLFLRKNGFSGGTDLNDVMRVMDKPQWSVLYENEANNNPFSKYNKY